MNLKQARGPRPCARTGPRSAAALAPVLVALVALAGCSGAGATGSPPVSSTAAASATPPGSPGPAAPTALPVATVDPGGPALAPLPGMPPVLDPSDVYAADRPGMMSPSVAGFPSRIYVPNTLSNTVTVIDPATFKVLGTFPVGREPQHVVPSWDLKTLWVNDDLGNNLIPIDPATGAFGQPVPVHDPYNLYFTPDGKYAVVMASADRELVFRDPHTMAIRRILHVPCAGVNHADFSADGRYFLVSCEFSGQILKVDTETMTLDGVLNLPGHSMPQDVKMAPDGHIFYVADMMANGIWLIDGAALRIRGFIATGAGAHGEYISRDSTTMYISNRGEGSISLLDVRTDRLVGKWWIPGGGSPDMGGLSADGTVLWLSGRYNGVVYAISTIDGHLLARIPVGAGPHGLCVYPQPGRYSLGHTGIFR